MLSTKLNRPILSKNLLHRTHLLERLEENSHLPLILISAPAGYGKSVLVSQWLKHYQKDFSWLSLDESMNDSFSFITYLIDTLEKTGDSKIQKIYKNKGELQLLSWEITIDRVVNSMNNLQKHLRLVLDDYHLIKNQEIHQLVKVLISENLSNLQVVILTRWDPPFQLREMRLYQKMLELRMRDLRFEKSEIYQLLSSTDSITFTDTEISALLENTEGWILAIRMFLLAKSFQAFDNRNSGNEILANDLDRLMLHISENIDPKFFRQMQICALFDKFDKQLISEICLYAFPDSCEAENFLSKLVELNFFLIPIRDEYGKFRFHHLIGEILKRQIESSEPELVRQIYSQISSWLGEKGQIDEAIRYSSKTKNYTLACNLIKMHSETLLDQGEWWVLQRWLNIIPRQIRNTNVDLLLTELIICEETWNLEDFFQILEILKSIGIESSSDENISQYLNHLGYFLAFVNPNLKKAVESLERSKALCPNERYMFGARRELILACSKQMLGLNALALQSLEEMEVKSEISSKIHIRSIHGKVIVHLLSGNFGSAISDSKKLRFLVQGSNFAYAEGWSWYFHGNISFHSFYVNETELALKKTFLFEGRLHYRVYFDALSGLTLISSLKRDKESTSSFLEQMGQSAKKFKDSKFEIYFDSIKARVSWHFGQGEKELDWAMNDWVNVSKGNYFILIDVPELTKLRIIVSHGSNQLVGEAIGVLATLEASLNKIHNNYHTIDIALLKAIAEFRLGNKMLAENSVEEALLLAEKTEMIRAILEVHHVFPDLFKLIKPTNKSFHVLSRLGLNKPTATLNPDKLNIKELTIREQEIVKLIANGLRNKEIGDRLYISTVTVKSHLTNIYRKLEVSNRTSMLRRIQN